MSDDADISLTLFHPPSSRTDAISLPPCTTLSDLAKFASALLDLNDDEGIAMLKDTSTIPIYTPNMDGNAEGEKKLDHCGICNGDFLSVFQIRELRQVGSGQPALQRARMETSNSYRVPPLSSGGLDFSSLLGNSSSSHSKESAQSTSSNGLLFNIPSILAATVNNSNISPSVALTSQPIQWDGMNLDDAIQRNPNPLHLMTVLSNIGRHPNLLKELNYHNPTVYKRLMSANGDIPLMATIWRETMMQSTTSHFLQRHIEQSKEESMRKRLEVNPMDPEANKYFGEKIRLQNVQKQYEQMMEEYPESMGRVLMLYMNCFVNDKPLQVFVDSGAQMTIMSSVCADRLGLLHLVDNRFEGTAVGVGTGKILGKIHIVDFTIGGYVFPCSITVMDSESGLGDKNMDCLFGLDMLKRHRCSIDLAKNSLLFPIGSTGEVMEAPFLHEKDLPKEKGGTLGFDAERENAEIEAMREKIEKQNDKKEIGKG